MTECQFCNSKLVTDGLNPGQQVRCASCLTLFKFGKIEKVATHRLAWRSFWLGLASIVLLFITGFPAMYYGIRSLLRMRFVKPKPSDRAAAIAGTALGGCFGIFVGFFAVCGMLVALFAFLTYQYTDRELEVIQMCNEVFDVDIPTGVKPTEAKSVFNNLMAFEFADSNIEADRKIRIQLRREGLNLQNNRNQLIRSLKQKQVNDQILGEPESTEILKWEMDGEAVDVRKTIYWRPRESDANEPSSSDGPEDESTGEVEMVETHQYFTYLFRPEGSYGLLVVFEPDGFALTESEVQAIFSSTKIIDTSKPKTPTDSR